MSRYLLLAGSTPALTVWEAQAVLSTSVQELAHHVLSFDAADDETAKASFALLGSAVKLAKVLKSAQTYSPKELLETLAELMTANQSGKLKFSVGQWDNQQTERFSLDQLKDELTSRGIKSRFLEGSRQGLSAAVLLHQAVTELIIFETDGQLVLAKTIDVQNIDEWTIKDRGKPYADRKKGMLPPKLARTMVNLALGSTVSPENVVYDPFCGTGTILMEALQRGARVVGSDNHPQAVEGAHANLTWFADKFQLPAQFTVFQSEVAHADLKHLPGKVDAIVTEPFLGKPRPLASQLPGIFRGLEKLYLGAFHQWRQLLKPGAKIVMIFPRVELPGGRTFDFSNFVDKLSPQGYTPQVSFGTLRYHRPQALVERDIIIFTYQG